MKLVSVIIPVYNVINTLERCVDSVLAQTYSNIEIILVDDGSTDGSADLCDKIQSAHPDIVVVHKNNEGLGPTRNKGVEVSHGEYLYHCDSDDWLEQTLIEDCVRVIERDNTEMVLFGYNMFTVTSGEEWFYDKCFAEECVLLDAVSVRSFFVRNYYNYFLVNVVWNKFWRRSFIVDNNLLVPSQRRSQDMAYALLTFDKLKKVSVISGCYYNYIIQPGVLNKGKSFSETIDAQIAIFKETEEAFNRWGLYTDLEKDKLVNKTCEVIANFTTHAMSVKYRKDWRSIARILLERQDCLDLLKNYSGNKSKFMKLFNKAVFRKSPIEMKMVAELHRMKEK